MKHILSVDVVPTKRAQHLSVDTMASMSWRLFRYLRSMPYALVEEKTVRGVIEVMGKNVF
jgi:hypothetical protein